MSYIPRVADSELADRLLAAGAVVIEGPKACGKTATALQATASAVRLDIDAAARQAVDVAPQVVLAGPAPRLIDEWQTAPTIWNHVRHEVDSRQLPGQFVLTGSATPADDPKRHTGTGRFSFLRMRPMSLFETGYGIASVSLSDLMAGGHPLSPEAPMSVEELAEVLVRGGWPAHHNLPVKAAAQASVDYLRQIREVDVNQVEGPRRDPVRLGRLISSLARNIATEVKVATLARDASGAGEEMSRNTVYDYLYGLDRLMVTDDQPAWAPRLRSKTPLRQAVKRHFADPSLAAAALGAGPERLASDLELLGLLFESLVVRDLRVLTQPLDGTVFHYRDKDDLEVDAIVHLRDGRWAAFEVKLGGEPLIERGAATLRRFAQVVDTKTIGPPTALAVICMSGYGYVRPDGVAVIPLRSLCP